ESKKYHLALWMETEELVELELSMLDASWFASYPLRREIEFFETGGFPQVQATRLGDWRAFWNVWKGWLLVFWLTGICLGLCVFAWMRAQSSRPPELIGTPLRKVLGTERTQAERDAGTLDTDNRDAGESEPSR
ncbi:MAG: hypothetical protein AAGJ35_08050, partial [Myxococcota bacterium]